jgi:hypothetical protein
MIQSSRLMLPISIIERPAFIEFMTVLDPAFQVAARKTVKESWLPRLMTTVDTKIKARLQTIPYINVSVDGWSDAVMRCFNGYIAQGIDMNWNLVTLHIAFQHVTVNRISGGVRMV